MPRITVNAEPRTLPDPLTVADLLRTSATTPTKLAVEVNRDVVPRAEHAARRLADGDAVEIVTLVGGGSPRSTRRRTSRSRSASSPSRAGSSPAPASTRPTT